MNELLNIIHLSRRKDREELLQRELESQHISKFKIWEGIEDLLIPWRGVSKAHKQIVLDAQVTKKERVIIAEDDIKFTDFGAFNFFIENIPPDFDLYLAGIYEGVIIDSRTEEFSGLTLYIINNTFYNTFLSVPEHVHLDRGLAGKGQFLVCLPFTAVQWDGYSDNLKQYCELTPFLKGRSLFKRANSSGRCNLF